MVAVVFLVLAALAAVPFFFFRLQSQELPSYEIQNFIGKVEVYNAPARGWAPAQRSGKLDVGDKIRTGDKAEVDLRVPNQIHLRIKENSEAEIRRPSLFDRALRYRLHLVKGSLLGTTEKAFEGKKLEISTPVLVAAVLGTTFQIEATPETHRSTVRVLEGTVKVKALKTRKVVMVKALEKTEVTGGAAPLKPVRVTREEWNKLKEGYDLYEKSAAAEAIQLDLSKEAGSLFKHVFDHGTFYSPNYGFADREFAKDKDSGKVQFKISYDVFPVGSFVGMYIKTRYLDLLHFKAFQFQIRGNKGEGYPQSVKIEFKNGAAVVRAFVPRDFKETWQTFEFPLHFTRSSPITEVTIVVSNEKAGDHKRGAISFRDFNLIPADKPVRATHQAAKPASAPAPPVKASPARDTKQPS